MRAVNYTPRWQAHLATNEAPPAPLSEAEFDKLTWPQQVAELKQRLALLPGVTVDP